MLEREEIAAAPAPPSGIGIIIIIITETVESAIGQTLPR